MGEICSLTHRALSWSFDLEGFIHYLACLSQATFCMSLYVINVQSSQQLIHVTMQRCWEKRESKKVFRFSLQGLSGFFFAHYHEVLWFWSVFMLLLYFWLFRRLGEPWANVLRNWMHGNGKTWGEMGGKMFQLLKLWWAVCIVLLIESSNILCLV